MLHPGAQAYARRDEPDFLERYSGIAEVIVTLLIGLVSGSYAIAKIIQRRRKNRIDTFYTDVLAIRYRMQDSDRQDEFRSAIQEIRELEEKAFHMLVNEELAADESFRIFTTLAAEVSDELERNLLRILP